MMLQEKQLAQSIDNYRTPLKEKVLIEIYKYANHKNKIAISNINRAGTMGASGVSFYLTGVRNYLHLGIKNSKRYGSYFYEIMDKCVANKIQQLTPKEEHKWVPHRLEKSTQQTTPKKVTSQPQTPKPITPDQYILLVDNEPIKLYNSIIECNAYGQAIKDINKDKEISLQIKGVKFFDISEE